MANVSFTVDGKTKRRMAEFRYMNWSAVARSAVEEQLDELEMLRKITDKSKLTEEDAIEIGRKINKAAAKRYDKLVGV